MCESESLKTKRKKSNWENVNCQKSDEFNEELAHAPCSGDAAADGGHRAGPRRQGHHGDRQRRTGIRSMMLTVH